MSDHLTCEIRTARLAELADGIRREHNAARVALQAGLSHAFHVGDLLIEAKALIPHGGWLEWLADNSALSERTAQLYMRVAKARPRLEKSATVAGLTLRGAVALLTPPTVTPLQEMRELHAQTMGLESSDRDAMRALVAEWNAVIDSLSPVAEWQEILLAGVWSDDMSDHLAEVCAGVST